MEILVLCGIYVAELVCYQLGLRILFQVRQRTWVWMVVGILLPVGIGVLQKPDIYGKNVLLAFCVIGIMFISIEEKIEEKSGSLVLIFLLLECVNAVFMAIVNNVLVDFKGNLAENISYLIVKCCTAISILLFNMVKDRIKYNENMHINSTVYLIIGIMACSMIFCLMFLNQVIDYLHYNNRYIIFCSILDIAILFSIFLPCICFLFVFKQSFCTAVSVSRQCSL